MRRRIVAATWSAVITVDFAQSTAIGASWLESWLASWLESWLASWPAESWLASWPAESLG